MPKPPKRTYIFSVQDGKMKISGRAQFDKDICAYEGKKGILTTEWLSKKRSLRQNAFYHGVLVPYMMQGLRDAGNDIDEDLTHKFIKSRFLNNGREIVIPKSGETVKTENTTTTLTTTEFMGLIAECQQFAAEFLNTIIPDPDPIWNIDQDEN